MNSKAQGLSLNYIVIAIVAALVLIIIVAFTTTGLGASLTKIFQASEQSTENADVDIAKAACKNLCSNAKTVDSPEAWGAESYCSRTYIFESNPTNCWEAPISVKCETSGSDIYDAFWTCSQDTCDRGCAEIKCSHCKDTAGESIDCPDEDDYNSCLDNNGEWDQ
ncbi:hypothetical protein HN924_00375 [Candidatus Woesearchaeota archaeon]|jgi:hypothetical protein|nr:hypothetical protein [Candidatus Woesearchaeota archaeon]MBT7062407.1 hypothetical protein [Candidatus Woesearchaeota archaeon]MBT7402959.1 hypothetical protein [Candidatus Woesearchaeota archaeon]